MSKCQIWNSPIWPLHQKRPQKLMTKTEDKDPKYKLTTTGVNFVRKNVLGSNDD